MSHESCDADYESHWVRVEGRNYYKKGALAAWELGSSRNHLSTFLISKLSYYQSKFFTYYVTGHKDYSVFHELCD